MRMFAKLALGTLALGLATSSASADFIVLSLEASASPSGPFTSNLQVTGGQTYFYEVTEQFEAFGTITNMKTLSLLVPPTDGINGLSFSIDDSASGVNPVIISFSAGTLQNGYGNGTGASGGTADGNGGVTGIRGLQSPGIFVGASNATATVVLSGTFTVPIAYASGMNEQIGLAWGGINSGFKINNGTSILATNNSENGVNGAMPYFSYNPLNLTSPSAVPEPTSLTLLATSLALAGLAAKRRRRA